MKLDPSAFFSRRVHDLSSTELLRGEQGSLRFQVQPEVFQNMSAYDPKTGETISTVFDPNEIIGIHLVDRDTKVGFPDGVRYGAALQDGKQE
jgi:hypothetical protein